MKAISLNVDWKIIYFESWTPPHEPHIGSVHYSTLHKACVSGRNTH